MRTEDELISALRQAAVAAPEPDLLKGVARRRRGRTRRRAQALAVAAVVVAAVVAVAGTTVATRISPHRGGGEVAVGVTSKTAVPEPPLKITKGTIDQFWSQELFKMPAESSDGWRYRPITAISATEVLLSAESSFEKAGRIEVYDSRSGTSRVVTDVPSTPGLRNSFMQRATVEGATMAWYTSASNPDGTKVTELWQAPLAGGEAKLIATLTGGAAGLDAISINGDDVYWSTQQGGVWRLPFAGGTPEPVPGGAGLHLIRWPWASDRGTLPAKDNQAQVTDLTNGGQTSSIVIPERATGVRCGPSWCYGQGDRSSFAQRIDGSAYMKLPGTGFAPMFGLSPYPILDRFLLGPNGIFDLDARRLGEYDTVRGLPGTGTSSEPSSIVYWGTTKGNKPRDYWVLNLAAVPPAQ